MVIYMGSLLGDSFNKVPTKKMKKKKEIKTIWNKYLSLRTEDIKKIF